MFDLPILEVALGLSFLYTLLSLFATSVQELIANGFRLRSKMLREGIIRMLEDAKGPHKLVGDFYCHPLVHYLGRNETGAKFPSYISKSNFAAALMDVLRDKAPEGAGLEHLLHKTEGILPKDTQRLLQSFWRDAKSDEQVFQARLELWFDESMQRVSGWYKREAQRIALGVGFVLAVILNADTFAVGAKLTHDKVARANLVSLATQYAGNIDKRNEAMHSGALLQSSADTLSEAELVSTSDSLLKSAARVLHEDLGVADGVMGLGWTHPQVCNDNASQWPFCRGGPPTVWWMRVLAAVKKLLGWAATACAIALGAPFWFDLLSRLVQLRSAGQRPDEKK